MDKFCEYCHNALSRVMTPATFSFSCPSCNTEEDADPSETLLEYTSAVTSLNILGAESIVRDDLNVKANIPCPKCKYSWCRQYRTAESLRALNCCINCKHSWRLDD